MPHFPSFAALPEPALLGILELLDDEDRYGKASLVCKAWRDAADSPSLLRSLDITLHPPPRAARATTLHPPPPARPISTSDRLRSAGQWLAARAAHVRELHLSVKVPSVKMEAILGSALTACCACGLTSLQLDIGDSCLQSPLSSMLLAGPRLQTLDVWSSGEGVLTVGSLRNLTALQELSIVNPVEGWHAYGASGTSFEDSHTLPPTLTKLKLGNLMHPALPPHLSTLTRLEELCFVSCECQADGFEPLAALPSLRQLLLDRCSVPACLSRLTALQQLAVCPAEWGGDEGEMSREALEELQLDTASLLEALPCLSALTDLTIGAMADLYWPPAEVAALTGLRSFSWYKWAGEGAVLPLGPWLAGLRRLAAPPLMLADSLAHLATAGNLEELGVTELQESNMDSSTLQHSDTLQHAVVAILRWAHSPPRLRRLVLNSDVLPGSVATAALALQARRPTLSIELDTELDPQRE